MAAQRLDIKVAAARAGDALKYTRPRDPAVIEIGSQPGEGEVTVFVRNNGVGFDMQQAPKLCDFFQGPHRARDFEGTGIGLAMQRIIARHGGRVWAQAKPEARATFYFTLPL